MKNLSQEIFDKVNVTLGHIRSITQVQPKIGVILGTGLGGLVKDIVSEVDISFNEIPNFPPSTAESHNGKLIFGKIAGKDVVALQGRLHYYEGYTLQEVTFPIRVLKALGIEKLIISSAGGSMNPYFKRKELMIIDDHINMLGTNPLLGINDNTFGPRICDLSRPYSPKLIELAEKIGLDHKIKLNKGVYIAMTGPSLETRAEYRFMRLIGADVVGMSTVPETIVANQMGIEVFGVVIITDECFPETLKPCSIGEIIAAAEEAEPKMTLLIREMIREL
jgi:purine-nucleoside phosphorylase